MPEPSTFSIRRAAHQDASGILQCLHAAFETYRESYTPEAFHDTVLTLETLHQRLNTMTLFVAVSRSNEIIGTIGCSLTSTEEGHIRGMAVQPGWHGCGVAEELLHSCESELRNRKCVRITLDTTQPLLRAIRFYERNGYRPTGNIADFFGMRLFEYVKQIE
jgi:ribosomal protein S18 acetylase RimI-like enzyme